MTDLILCSAATFETDALVARLSAENVRFTRIICGVGAISAAATAANLRELVAGRSVVFVGTAGAIGDARLARDLFMAGDVSLLPYDVRCGQTQLVENFDPPVSLDTPDWGLPLAKIAASSGVSVAHDTAHAFSGYLESMELYSVARLWRAWCRQMVGIFYVTNTTGPTARSEWKENFSRAAATTADVLAPILINSYGGGP